MNRFKEQFLKHIESYQDIAIYRHEFPDGDALGSQWGLATWLKEEYPDKNIMTIGDTEADYPESLYPAMDNPQLPSIFLAMIVDTANHERIDNESYKDADFLIKIDHHLIVDNYADLDYVEENAGSCCEIIARLLEDKNISSKVANYLLSGILTDTLRFSIENTHASTLITAAHLMQKGADIVYLQRELFSVPFVAFRLRSRLMTYVVNEDGLGVMQLNQSDLADLGLKARDAKRYVSLMGNVFEFKIWMTIIEDEDGLYMGSLRSQQITVSDIANEYHGGGHRLACGYKSVNAEEVPVLKEKLHQRIKGLY